MPHVLASICILVSILVDRGLVAALPSGVTVEGTLYKAADIQSGTVQISTGSYIIGLQSGVNKTFLLQEMLAEFGWTPTFAYSETFPMVAGVLNHAQVIWLLGKEEVKYIEQDGIVSIAEGSLPIGVSVDGTVHRTADIESGKVQLSTGIYIVGVNKENKAALLQELESEFNWQPKLPYSDSMPMFAGELNHTQILWLLKNSKVKYIEKDAKVTAKGPSPGPSPIPVSQATSSMARGGAVLFLSGTVFGLVIAEV